MNNETPPTETIDLPVNDFPTGEDVTNYVNYAETEQEPVYNISFIQEEICTGELTTMTIAEFGSCSNFYNAQATIGFGNIILGVVLGFIIIKGLFETWR